VLLLLLRGILLPHKGRVRWHLYPLDMLRTTTDVAITVRWELEARQANHSEVSKSRSRPRGVVVDAVATVPLPLLEHGASGVLLIDVFLLLIHLSLAW